MKTEKESILFRVAKWMFLIPTGIGIVIALYYGVTKFYMLVTEDIPTAICVILIAVWIIGIIIMLVKIIEEWGAEK